MRVIAEMQIDRDVEWGGEIVTTVIPVTLYGHVRRAQADVGIMGPYAELDYACDPDGAQVILTGNEVEAAEQKLWEAREGMADYLREGRRC